MDIYVVIINFGGFGGWVCAVVDCAVGHGGLLIGRLADRGVGDRNILFFFCSTVG